MCDFRNNFQDHRDFHKFFCTRGCSLKAVTSFIKMARKKSYIFCFYYLKLHLHNFLKIKSHKEVTKQQESRFFVLFLLDDRRIRIGIHISYKRIQSREAPKHTQHCWKRCQSYMLLSDVFQFLYYSASTYLFFT